MIKVLLPICTLIWRVNNYVFHQVKRMNRRNESTVLIIKIVAVCYCTFYKSHLTVAFIKILSLRKKRRSSLLNKIKLQFNPHC